MGNSGDDQKIGTTRDGPTSLGQDAYLRIRAAKVTQLLNLSYVNAQIKDACSLSFVVRRARMSLEIPTGMSLCYGGIDH